MPLPTEYARTVKISGFMASGKSAGYNVTGPVLSTPREAAEAFFKKYPVPRNCNVTGVLETGPHLVHTVNGSPRYYGIARKDARCLPESLDEINASGMRPGETLQIGG